ncbi:MAG: RNase P subunit p30 family protein [Candidatus Asgardarchaeia archaeon]
MRKKRFVEPNVPFQENNDKFKLILESLKENYHMIALTVSSKKDLNEIKKYKNDEKISSRFFIKSETITELKDLLKKVRFKVDLISVYPTTRKVAAFSARDHRVDILCFDHENFKLFSDSVAKLALDNEKIVEINIGDIIRTNHGIARVSKMGKIRAIAQRALRYKLPIILTVTPTSLYDIRSPREVMYLGELVDIPSEEIIKGNGEIILGRIMLNRKKRKGEYILPGVRILQNKEKSEDDSR